MEHTQTQETSAETVPLKNILQRNAEPFAIFSGSLLLLLVLAQFVVLPLFNRFEVDGQQLKPDQLARYQAQLTQEVAEAEADRDLLVLPVKNETYHFLQAQKENLPPLVSVKSSMEEAARETQGAGSIVFLHFDFDGRMFHVRGDVRAGLSSMTVLAAFIEKAEALPFIATFNRPTFTREEHETLGAHSPFEFSFTMKQ